MTSCVRHIEFFFISDIKKLDLSYQKFSPQMEYKESKQRLEKWNKAVAAARLFEWKV